MGRMLEELTDQMKHSAEQLIQQAADIGLPIKITQTGRTFAEQNALYKQGRTVPGKVVTNARGGESPHNFSQAFDVAFVDDVLGVTWEEPRSGAWEEIGCLGESLGLVWGGHFKRFKDRPHFECVDWRKSRERLA